MADDVIDPHLANELLLRQITPESRLAILWLKHAYLRLGRYGAHDVRSVDVYQAVLERGVRTPAEFAAYHAQQHRPA